MNPTHVECSICLETYKPPIRMTNCGHSFCEGCIMPAYPKPGWRCPLCNTIHNHSAATLARNYLAEEIVASFQVQPSAPPPSALTTSGGEFGMCNWHQQNITIYCTAHSQDQCFQCADEKVCGGVKRSDCKTETKVAIKNLIGRETKIVQDHANDIISKIENQTAILINKFMDEETKAKTRIRDTEKDLLEKIKQNPHKWSSNSLKFKMTTETSLTPSVGVEILKNSQISEISGESVMRNSSNQNLQNEKTSDYKFTGPKNEKNEQRMKKIETPFGHSYIDQADDTVGLASCHFDGNTPYISFENAPFYWRFFMSNNQKLPSRSRY